ncbi:MAG: MFS transporter [Chloroflexi bacterium]|nr:MFS transporter [Chloroflexota bacterium]
MSLDSNVSPRRRQSAGTFRAFANHKFKFFWPANFLLYVSRWMQMTLMAWFVLELTNSAWFVSLLGFFTWLPMLLLGLIGGLLADSVNRRALLAITQLLALAVTIVVMALLFTGLMELWHAYVAVLVTGVSWALDMPARSSVIHDMLGADGVTNGMSLDSVGMTGSTMIGPALAGLLITLFDVQGGYAAMVCLQLMAFALLFFARIPTSHGGVFAPSKVFDNLVEGLRYARIQKSILAVVVITVVMNLLLFPIMQMVPVIARDVLHVGPGLMGVLQSASGLGSFIGSLFIASLSVITRHGRIFLGGSLLGTLGLLAFSLSPWYSLSFAVLLIMGVGVAGFAVMQMTTVMLVSKDDMRGRALGVVSLAIGVSPFGALLIGALASAIGTANAVTVNAVSGLILLGLIALVMPSFWREALNESQADAPQIIRP